MVSGYLTMDESTIDVLANGLVFHFKNNNIQTICNVNLRKFPFDTQNCSIEISSGKINRYIRIVDAEQPGVLTEEYGGDITETNNEWSDVEVTTDIYPLEITFQSELQYTDILVINIAMRRNPVFYVMYILIPSVLMAFMSVLVFLLPPDAGERVGLSITVLLSYAVFLLMVSEFTPRGGNNTPFLGEVFSKYSNLSSNNFDNNLIIKINIKNYQ